jgi:all-trans-retinol 13,14-reductase
MKAKNDVIIIGSGLGGLSCGVILAKNGYHVTVLEQSNQIGGCLQCFSRHGARFETGMHFVGSAGEGQTLARLMHYLEIDKDVRLSQLDPSGYDVVALGGKRYKFANGREAFIRQMTEYFPEQHDNLVHYYDLVEEIANASSLHSLKYAESDAVVNAEYQLRSIDEVIDSIITDPLLAKVLVGNLPLYAAEKGKTPFSTHAFIMDFYNQSAYRFIGGSDTVAQSLASIIRKYGGEIKPRSRATHIVCEDTHATGVEINYNDVLTCDYVISDAHPIRTLELLDSHLIRPAFRKRINSIPQTLGGFTVYLRFKEGKVPYLNYNYYGYQDGTPWDCEKYTEQDWPKGFLYMHFCQQEHPRFATTGVILSYMQMSDVEQWKGTKVGHRGQDYEDFKHRKAELLIDTLEKHFPGIRDKIEEYYTSTPLTYLNYTGTEGGSMYGNAKDISLGAACRVPPRTRVPNVYLTGQNINSHGMLGVLVGTIVTCSEFITAKAIYEQIKQSEP